MNCWMDLLRNLIRNKIDMSKKDKPVKVSTGHYKYKGYDIRFYGYHHPDKRVWWEAVNEETGCADYHCTTLRQIIQQIDEELT